MMKLIHDAIKRQVPNSWELQHIAQEATIIELTIYHSVIKESSSSIPREN